MSVSFFPCSLKGRKQGSNYTSTNPLSKNLGTVFFP